MAVGAAQRARPAAADDLRKRRREGWWFMGLQMK
jgi:hypothetical protein